jgi:hypothetical protein
MRLIGIMPVRNEEWVLGLSLRVALLWCDAVVVLEHASTDGTAGILAAVADESPDRVTILSEPSPLWAEMSHRQRLLEAARALRATHIALIDADEVLTANTLPMIRGAAERLRPAQCLVVPMRAMWRSPDRYRVDPGSLWTGATITVAFRDAPGICWRAAGGYDFHHREPYGSHLGQMTARGGGVMHLQFADRRRMVAKHALYKITEMLRWPRRRPAGKVDGQYAASLDEAGLETAAAPADWWHGLPREHLHIGLEPWQEREVRRLWELYGAARFEGLDLYGLPDSVPPLRVEFAGMSADSASHVRAASGAKSEVAFGAEKFNPARPEVSPRHNP